RSWRRRPAWSRPSRGLPEFQDRYSRPHRGPWPCRNRTAHARHRHTSSTSARPCRRRKPERSIAWPIQARRKLPPSNASLSSPISPAAFSRTIFFAYRLRGEDDVLTLADMPGDDETLDSVDDPEQDNAKQREDHERGEHRRQVERADRAL